MENVNRHLCEEFAKAGVRFEAIYIAPEAPGQASRGRKPSPQFLFDARDEFSIDLGRSYLIGDKLMDLECGWNAGVRKSILLRTGYGAELERNSPGAMENAAVVGNLTEAATWILKDHPSGIGAECALAAFIGIKAEPGAFYCHAVSVMQLDRKQVPATLTAEYLIVVSL